MVKENSQSIKSNISEGIKLGLSLAITIFTAILACFVILAVILVICHHDHTDSLKDLFSWACLAIYLIIFPLYILPSLVSSNFKEMTSIIFYPSDKIVLLFGYLMGTFMLYLLLFVNISNKDGSLKANFSWLISYFSISFLFSIFTNVYKFIYFYMNLMPVTEIPVTENMTYVDFLRKSEIKIFYKNKKECIDKKDLKKIKEMQIMCGLLEAKNNEQIKELHTLLDQQQKISAQLKLQLEEVKQETKKNWWFMLFS